jgi:hypothetical protein
MENPGTDRIEQILESFDREIILNYTQSKLKEVYRKITRTIVAILTIINIIAFLVIVFFIQGRTSRHIDEALSPIGTVNIEPNPIEKTPPAVESDSGISDFESKSIQSEDLIVDFADDAGQFGDIFTENDDIAFVDEFGLPDEEADGQPQITDSVLDETVVRTILEKDGKLLRHESEGDLFVMLSPWEGLLNTVIGNDSFFVTSKYDVHLRLASRTEWQKEQDAPDPQTVRRAIYFDTDNAAKTAQKRELYSFADSTVEKTEYDFDGLPLRVTVSKQAEKSGTGAKKDELISETLFKYDEQRRVTEKKTLWFSSNGGEQRETTRYTYTEKAGTPDTYIYHGDSLSYSAVYDADGNYTESRMLNETYSVMSRYENYELTREVYLFNGKEFRRREY